MVCVKVLSMDLLFGKPYASLNLPASNTLIVVTTVRPRTRN